MDDNTLQRVRLTLTNYLEENKCRKTPERYAILEAIYDMEGHFTLEELSAKMEQQAFRVSRATLYNAIHLFIKLRLVVRHNFQQGTRYEASFQNDNHCHQVCTICGKVKEVQALQVTQAVEKMKLKRFHQTGFALYLYGVCTSCQTKINRAKAKNAKTKTKNNPKK